MIKFFRNIRKKLLKEYQFKSYLLYAIGEIILVVVGILIALQIDNINELRKTEDKIISILKEVQYELGLDIQKSDELITFYKASDSIINLVLKDKLTFEDYENDLYDLRNVTMYAFHMKIHTNGYTSLMANIDNIPIHFKEIINPLNEIYIYNKYEIDKYDQRVDEITDRMIDDLAYNKGWYYKLEEIQLDNKIIDYFLHDEAYKNISSVYKDAGCINLSYNVRIFRSNAVKAYKRINELIDSKEELPDFIPHHQINITEVPLEDYVGTYQLEKLENFPVTPPDIKMKFWIEGNQLVAAYIFSLDDIKYFYFEALDKAHEIDIYNKVEFRRNNKEEITDLIYRSGNDVVAYFKKMEDEE